MYPEVFTQLPLDIKTYQVKQMAGDINDLISTLIIYIFSIYAFFSTFSHFSGRGPGASLAVVGVWVAASQLAAPGGLGLPRPQDRGQLVTVAVRGRLEA